MKNNTNSRANKQTQFVDENETNFYKIMDILKSSDDNELHDNIMEQLLIVEGKRICKVLDPNKTSGCPCCDAKFQIEALFQRLFEISNFENKYVKTEIFKLIRDRSEELLYYANDILDNLDRDYD